MEEDKALNEDLIALLSKIYKQAIEKEPALKVELESAFEESNLVVLELWKKDPNTFLWHALQERLSDNAWLRYFKQNAARVVDEERERAPTSEGMANLQKFQAEIDFLNLDLKKKHPH